MPYPFPALLTILINSKIKKFCLSIFGAVASVILYAQKNSKLEFQLDGRDERLRKVLEECPSIMKRNYYPTLYLPIGFLHLIYGGYVKKFDKNLQFTKEKVELANEDFLTLGTEKSYSLRQSKFQTGNKIAINKSWKRKYSRPYLSWLNCYNKRALCYVFKFFLILEMLLLKFSKMVFLMFTSLLKESYRMSQMFISTKQAQYER